MAITIYICLFQGLIWSRRAKLITAGARKRRAKIDCFIFKPTCSFVLSLRAESLEQATYACKYHPGNVYVLATPGGWIFFPQIWRELQFQGSCACANKIPKQQYLWTWCQSVVPNDAPRDFDPEVAFWSQVSDTCRQAGRETECRPLDHT